MKMKPEFKLAKSLPGHSQMERVRAARAMLETRLGTRENVLGGFLSIFHPEIPRDKAIRMARDAYR